MSDPDALNIWNGRRLVGYLRRDSFGHISFRYDNDWLSGGGFAISQTLPLSPEEFTAEEGVAHRFFANLLPEGGFRERIVRDLKISDTDFNLLRAIGGECAGALSVLPEGRQPSVEQSYRPIDDEELAGLIAQRGQPYSWSKEKRARFSLAGAQNKFPILVREGKYLLPQGESPSSHILKFEIEGYRNVPAYETFTTLLARAVGLPVINIELRSINNIHYTITQRYDRFPSDDGEVLRAHQEDFCQALGYGHERKYQEDGGPSFAQCFGMLRDVSSDPATDLPHLLRWQIFNVLAGNSDGHAKNLSLLYKMNGEIRLAPFYDLVCTRAIERIDPSLAMSVGKERNPGIIVKCHWEDMARQCDVRPRYLLDLVNELARLLPENLASTRAFFENKFGGYPALQRIEQVVNKQCRRTIRN
ncbi:MAG: type II toxin-antitoxin system HipA family toxin [Candidatus Dadabacteria bacterium]|nr:type II toxin-antitoxin system HipA family toxin [Candidatus Dadabacteria bacterium]